MICIKYEERGDKKIKLDAFGPEGFTEGEMNMTALTFKPEHIEQIKRGGKTQTRRLLRPGMSIEPTPGPTTVVQNGRLKWQVGRRRAIKPGRTAKGVGFVRITGIRREHLCDISREDAIAEGIYRVEMEGAGGWQYAGCRPHDCFSDPRTAFAYLWNSINDKKTAWQQNPEVWVLEFVYEEMMI